MTDDHGSPALAPLDGLRVLDISRLQPGAFAGRMLADLGADVLRVEPPSGSDPLRTIPGEHDAYNRGKRSITLDMKHSRAPEVIRRLVSRTDVVLESGRPGSLEPQGIGYRQLAEEHPALIWCAITAFGQHSPNIDRSGHDITFLGYSGLLSLMAGHAIPPTPDFVLGVPLGGLMAVIGVLAAVAERGRTGRGRLVDASIVDAATWILSEHVARVAQGGAPGWGAAANRRAYRCGDGRLITVAAAEARTWQALCTGLGRPDLDERLWAPPAEQDEIADALATIFATRPAAEWVDRLADAGAAVGPVHEVQDLFEDRHVVARGSIVELGTARVVRNPIRLLDADGREDPVVMTGPPALGAHTDHALGEAGYQAHEIAALRADGVL